jgi:hypothetical protein
METRNIKVTLEKAKEWYRSGNLILVELALQAFTKKELDTPTYPEIALLVGTYNISEDEIILRTFAEYYKRDTDRFYPDQEKYFIGKNSYDGWTIIKHSSVLYPGIAYYLREKDAKEALEIFLEETGYKNH